MCYNYVILEFNFNIYYFFNIIINRIFYFFSSIIIEESNEILEIQSFLSMFLQSSNDLFVKENNLKRIVMVGSNNSFITSFHNDQFFFDSNFDQSLFTRLIRLGVKNIILDKQVRSRPEISELYAQQYFNSDYNNSNVLSESYNKYFNAGFLHHTQCINVNDHKSQGEVEASPNQYTNMGEALYILATFQYMRLIGYPNEKISIITSYDSQMELIQKLFMQRCLNNPKFGMPASISTIDKFKGLQNDIILVSMVRTNSLISSKDIQNFIYSLSRARLGLYVYCRKDVFQNVIELSHSIKLLGSKSDDLQLIPNEKWPSQRQDNTKTDLSIVKNINSLENMELLVYNLQL